MQNLAQKRNAAGAERSFEVEETSLEVARPSTTIEWFVQQLSSLGVENAFGVSGGAIALLFDALAEGPIELHHFRHETGAAFAATEAHFASGKPTVVFATTGPGLLNALTGITAARWDGAKVILISGATNPAQRGRWASQETSPYTIPQDTFYTQGPIFDFAVRVENPAEMPEVLRRLGNGLTRPGRFVAHVCLPMSVQSGHVDGFARQPIFNSMPPSPSSRDVATCARKLKEHSFVIWAGFGATLSAHLVLELAERSGAKIICSPRAKGVVPETHPQFIGVSGLGGHESVTDYMLQQRPRYALVLGTRLGEATSFWDRDLIPEAGFIHVDLDPEVPGTAYPEAETLAVHSEIGLFLEDLLDHFPPSARTDRRPFLDTSPHPLEAPGPMRIAGRGSVRPQVLMRAMQREIVEESQAIVLSECGNAFAWCNHYLRFDTPGRYRVSTLFGSMGHAASGVVGAAIASGQKAVAVVGDGSMLMNCEISSAAQYRVPAVWLVLNDSGYGMCRDGLQTLGLSDEQLDFPRVEFVSWARAVGADGVQVDSEEELEDALRAAMAAEGPFVVDIRIDPNEASPLLKRFESLIKQGNSKNVAGWEA